MKKILFTHFLIIAFINAKAQSITISPTNNPQVTVTSFSRVTPSFIGQHAGGTGPFSTFAFDILLLLGGGGHTGNVLTNPTGTIAFTANQAFSSGGLGTNMVFSTTADNTTTLSERMRISHNGNVGIGISPLRKLHVKADGFSGATPLSSEDFFFENSGTSYLGIAVPNASETGILFGKASSAASGGVIYSPTNDMSLRTGGNNTRMLITSAGNVGIGVNPTAKFTVNGDVAYSGKTNSTTTGTINDFNRAGNSVIRFDGIGDIILNGITGGTDGLIVHIYTTFNVTQLSLGNQNGGSLPENQIITGGSILLFNDGAISLIYDGTSQKWRVLHFQQ